jgi:hypothetical protein
MGSIMAGTTHLFADPGALRGRAGEAPRPGLFFSTRQWSTPPEHPFKGLSLLPVLQ